MYPREPDEFPLLGKRVRVRGKEASQIPAVAGFLRRGRDSWSLEKLDRQNGTY
jgi:hypothetical protein